MRPLLLGDVLSTESRERLLSYMLTSPTGNDRLRVGFPKSYRVADKTGTGGNGAVNDVAVVWPPNHAPLLVACYLSESHAALPTLASGHGEVARLVARVIDGRSR